MTAIENWYFVAAALPYLVAMIVRYAAPAANGEARRLIAIAVYVAYGLLGSWLAGDLDGFAWTSARVIAENVLAIIVIGYASYRSLFLAFPVNDTPTPTG